MSKVDEMISYVALLNLLRVHLDDGISGRITGISEKQHSFQIGFEKGKIVFLTYRILKSAAALEKLRLIDAAKIVEHLGVSLPSQQVDLPDTETIMARLAMGKSAADSGAIGNAGIGSSPTPPSSSAGGKQVSSSAQVQVDVSQVDAIKRSAAHSFGPFGAMMCDKHLTPSNLANADLRTLLVRIAKDLGASDADAQAFIGQVMP